jgi:hypothetical protein
VDRGLVAVVATLSKGYDLDYIWKQVDRGPVKDAGPRTSGVCNRDRRSDGRPQGPDRRTHRRPPPGLGHHRARPGPPEDPDYGDLGPAFPARTDPGRKSILQPPRPEIPPSPQILQKVVERDIDWEAAD